MTVAAPQLRASALVRASTAISIAVFATATLVGIGCVVLSWHPLPWWDHWETVADYEHFLRHGLDLGRIFAQHNEHRMVFSNLLNLADYRWFSGASVFLLAVNVVASCSVVALLMRFSDARRLGATGLARFLFCTAAGTSVTQLGNLAWSFQTAWYVVALFALLAIRAYQAGADDEGRVRAGWLVAAWALSAASTFSNANGMLTWIALLLGGALLRRSARVQIATAFIGAVVIAWYLHGYRSPPGHPPVSGALRDPLGVAEFVALYASNSVQQIGYVPALILGGAVLLVVLAHVLVFLTSRVRADRDRTYPAVAAAWLLGTMGITALGRVGLGGPGVANASRYVTYGMMLLLCVVLLLARSLHRDGPAPWLLPALAGLIAAFTWSGLTGPPFREAMSEKWMRVDVALCDRIGACSADDYRGVYPDVRLARERMAFLRERRLSLFAPGLEPRIPAAFAAMPDAARLPACTGHVDSAAASADGVSVVRGWLTFPGTRRPPEFVSLLTPDGAWIGGGGTVEERPDVQRNLRVRLEGPWRSFGFKAWSRQAVRELTVVGFSRDGAERCRLTWSATSLAR